MKTFILTVAITALVCLALNGPQANGASIPKVPGPPHCTDDMEGVLFPDPFDCAKYYICSQGKAVEMFCYPGTWFNIDDGECDYPQEVQCVVSAVTTLGTGRPATVTPSQ